jgi:membrane protease YdiL (CAAX protease family)
MRKAHWAFQEGAAGVLGAGRWLRARAVLWSALLSAGTMALFLTTQFLGSWLHLPPNFAYVIVLGIPILTFILYAFIVRAGEKRRPVEVLVDRQTIPDLLLGAAIGVVMLCLMTALLWSLGLYQVKPNHMRHAFDSFVFDSYLSGMMEELFFRAILLRILARAFGPVWGLVHSAALFGLAHLSHGSWLPVFEIAVNAGLPLGLLYMVTGRLWMAVGLHTAWDFAEESLLGVNTHHGLLLSTPVHGKSAVLTGGAYGPDGSLLSISVGLLSCVVILWIAKNGWFQKKRTTTCNLHEPVIDFNEHSLQELQ